MACGIERRKPKLAPEAASIALLGPGVIDATNAKLESVANTSSGGSISIAVFLALLSSYFLNEVASVSKLSRH
jgi:hypothetical protein